jgi:hypothetical protein
MRQGARLLSLLMMLGSLLAATPAAHAAKDYDLGRAIATCDFNNDGFADLAAGAPGATVDGAALAGHVDVIYGSSTSLQISATSRRTWNQGQLGQGRLAQAGAEFGRTLAAGDFNNDGFCDLAVGVPAMDYDVFTDAGVVDVLYGSVNGLIATGVSGVPSTAVAAQRFGVRETARNLDRFADALASADFNNDGYADLAIGMPNYDYRPVPSASPFVSDSGLLHVIYGSAAGLQLSLPDDYTYVSDYFAPERLGSTLAVGDFNDDDYADLAVGAPYANETSTPGPALGGVGRVQMFYGSASGLLIGARLNQYSVLRSTSTTDANDHFGYALAAGDVNGDTIDDLIIGVEDGSPTLTSAGQIIVMHGTSSGLSLAIRLMHQDTTGIPGSRQTGDLFGAALVVADFNDDSFEDVAVGVPRESVTGISRAGYVNLIYGSATGLTSTGAQGLSQDSSGISESCDGNDYFGTALAAGDFNGDGKADLAVAAPFDDRPSGTNSGVINVVHGDAAGVTFEGDIFIE